MQTIERTITSNEVSEMVGKEHSKLIRDIRTYVGYLAEAKIGSGDFFIESSYSDSNKQERPNYLLTKQGCEMVSNKLTGAKGVQFTARYVSRFNQMENHIKQQSDTSNLSPELQMFNGIFQSLVKQEQATKQLESKVDNISDIVGVNYTNWREECNKLINKVVNVRGGFDEHKNVRSEIHKEVDKRAGVSLSIRLTNKRRRMADNGVSVSQRNKLSKTDVIAEDKKLIEIYTVVVKELAIKYKVF
ncbi:Rha family transcriptional regulator [Brochothrix thermosphacta]|uniref:Rha family transcriptional regulator n=1 Tax=Brochothrix thermosphacta TaxID=2756 RepID=UPI0003E856A8|nr:Rha family transcriptional regulator [Brochothrix thermosphacta]EUJ38164.1 phage regulatory protein [Brochothrix thermosphacta DSM 20171 = FSL F6-1036]ODJ49236.1 Rha family transcriptional regulator [Brochothrix thermosphacta DSM 20171 = FSL F6-1036]